MKNFKPFLWKAKRLEDVHQFLSAVASNRAHVTFVTKYTCIFNITGIVLFYWTVNVTVYSKLNAYRNFEIISEATGVRERVTTLEIHSSVIFMLYTINCMIKRLQWCVYGLCYEMVNNVTGYLEREKDYSQTRCRMGEWDNAKHFWLFGFLFCLGKCSRM